mmetsp:Transcript_112131/g.349464  ORF Transcript_112131/g.349464 Transcript_112131/m.349464 type:complete len:318 (+) Transcript_112131:70-1023(+)
MGTKVWNFLLPNAGGQHQLRVEKLGTQGQAVFIDGEQQPAREAQIFAGPGDSLLELRKGQAGQWSLLVNGLIVEDYCEGKRNSKDESLRELRGKADGSYLISTGFDATNLRGLNVIRIFRFAALGESHELQVSHHECIWQVLYDGKLVERLVHRLNDNNGSASFKLEVGQGVKLEAALRMTWLNLAMVWRYTLRVNGVEIPHCWSKVQGDVEPPPPVLDVLPPTADGSAPQPEPAEAEPEDSPDPEPQPPAPQAPQTLPQGVSYDGLSGAYQATIRAKTGKFVFLGEFRTAEEAHACYLEAVPRHRPDRAPAPEIPP